MPRRNCCVLAGVPCHITQRGVDRRETFSSPHDRLTYLRLVGENLEDSHARVLAYCLEQPYPSDRRAGPRACGLTPDGIVGMQTWGALRSGAPPKASPVPARAGGIMGPMLFALPRPVNAQVQKFVQELGTVDDFVQHVQQIEATKGAQYEVVMRALWDFETTSNGARYLLTSIEGGPGVIDFRHFFAAAAKTYSPTIATPTFGSRGGTLVLGVGNELAQCVDELRRWELDSCFSAEDLHSNHLGADFGEAVKIALAEHSPRRVSEMLRTYLLALKPASSTAIQDVKLPSRLAVAREALAAVLLGIYDFLVPSAY